MLACNAHYKACIFFPQLRNPSSSHSRDKAHHTAKKYTQHPCLLHWQLGLLAGSVIWKYCYFQKGSLLCHAKCHGLDDTWHTVHLAVHVIWSAENNLISLYILQEIWASFGLGGEGNRWDTKQMFFPPLAGLGKGWEEGEKKGWTIGRAQNNKAEPKTDKWFSSPSHFSLFNCCLSVVL